MSVYKPIACGLHEQYQFAAMKKRWVILAWEGELGSKHSGKVLPIDVFTREKAEYLLAQLTNNREIEIRLDRIQSAHWVQDGMSLG